MANWTESVDTDFDFCEESLEPLPVGSRGNRAVLFNSLIYACGGNTGYGDSVTMRTACYTSPTDAIKWSTGPSFNEGRSFYSLVQVGDSLVAAGGRTTNKKLDSVEILSSSAQSWQLASWTLETVVKSHCAEAISDTEMVIIGGVEKNGNISDKVTKYNINTGAATSLAPYPSKIHKHACARDGDYIYVTGGEIAFQVVRDVRRYSISNNAWESLPRGGNL